MKNYIDSANKILGIVSWMLGISVAIAIVVGGIGIANIMTISVTESAVKHISEQLKTRGQGLGIRVGVKTTGCSGMAYVLEFVDELEKGDAVFEDHGVKIVVDRKSLAYLKGTQMDYVKQGVNEGFEFKNPNAKGECGCGESFSV